MKIYSWIRKLIFIIMLYELIAKFDNLYFRCDKKFHIIFPTFLSCEERHILH